MPAAPKLPVKLCQKLGKEAMTDLAGWFAEMEARRQEMDAKYQATVKDLNASIEHLNTSTQQLSTTTQQLKEAGARLEAKMERGFAELKVQIAGVQAELIKWTFVFWLGTVGIVVLLIR